MLCAGCGKEKQCGHHDNIVNLPGDTDGQPEAAHNNRYLSGYSAKTGPFLSPSEHVSLPVTV